MKRLLVLLAGPLSASFFAVSAQTTPKLIVQSVAPQILRIAWPNTAIGFELEQSNILPNGAIWQSVNQTPLNQNNKFSVLVNAAQGNQFFRLRVPAFTSIRETSPVDGETGVAVIRETIVHFSAPLASNAVVTTDNFYAGYGGLKILSRVELSTDRRKATLFYLEPMPGSTRINAVFDGTGLTDQLGRPLDVDGDGVPGGFTIVSFDTLNTTPLTGTAVVGTVFASELMPGPDAGTNAINRPLEGVTITVDGMEETLRAITDAQGKFTLAPAPPGRFFVKIDGRTAKGSQWPTNAYYPYVGKAWDAVVGKTNNLAGGTGQIFLPLIAADTLQPVSMTADTTISFPPSVISNNPALAGLSITVPANSLFSDDGSRGGKVGIAPVPPDRLPGPLPPGVELPLVITVQTDGPLNFDKPASLCFPNLPNPTTGQPWPPGTKGDLISFNHKKGVWEPVGGMTVGADGKLFCTDPGVGILQPGWHGALSPKSSSPPPPPKPVPCHISPDAYPGCLGTCSEDLYDCRAGAYGMADLDRLACDYRFNHGATAANTSICYETAVLNRTANLGICAHIDRLCSDTCARRFACNFSTNAIPAPRDRLAPASTTVSLEAAAGTNPIGDQLDAIFNQIDELIQPFAPTYSPISMDILNQIHQLIQQANAVAGGESAEFLRSRIIAGEEQFAASARQIGLEPDDLKPGNAPSYPVLYAATVSRPGGLFVFRGETGPFGQYFIFVPPDGTLLDVSFYDPKTKEFGIITPNLSPNAPYALPRFTLAPLASDAADFDHDGLPDLVENVYGSDPTKADTDGDGISDGAEVDQGTNPLDGFIVQNGVIATAKTPGSAVDLWTGNDLIVTAEGAAGVSVFNAYTGANPTIIAQVPTPGNALRVAGSGNFIVVAEGDAGLSIIDLSTPATPRISFQLPLPGVQAVAADGGTAYVGLSNGIIASIDLATGVLLNQVSVTNSVRDLALAGDYLYTLTDNRLFAISLVNGAFALAGSTSAPYVAAPNQRLFAGGGVAYSVHRKGYDTFDLADPANPKLIAAGNTTQFGWKQIVSNGSGLGLAAVGPNSVDSGPHDISLYDLSNPTNTDLVITTFPTPGIARAVSIFNGLAYVADDAAGLDVINYLAYDAKGVPPIITLATSFPTNGAVGAAPVRVTANASDDVQVRNVEFYLDGTNVFTDGNFPFEYRFVAPALTTTKTNFTLRARAFDTGGNFTWTDELVVSLLPDTTPPQIKRSAPLAGARIVNNLLAYFNEPMNPATLNAASFQVISAGPDGLLGTADDVPISGGVVSYQAEFKAASLNFASPLPVGLYRAAVTSIAADVAGNRLAADYTWQFRVADAVFWSSSTDGFWDDPNNWSTGAVPGPNDNVIADVFPADPIITIRKGTIAIKSLVANQRVTLNGGILEVSGDIELKRDFTLNGGTIKGGTVTFADGAKLICTSNPNSVLDGVSLKGDLDVTASFAQVGVRNGLTLTGSVLLENSGTITSLGSQTLDTGSIVFGDTFGRVVLVGNTILTLGPDMVVRGKSGNLNGTGKLINQGLISAEVAGGTITINPSQFENTGTIQSRNGGSLSINGAAWSSTGLIDAADGGTLALGGTWSNLGMINANGVTMNLGGVFGLPQLGVFHRTGGTVNLTGTLNLSGDTLALNATTGSWALNGGTIKGGTVTLADGAKLICTGNPNSVLDGVSLKGDLEVTASFAQVGVRNGLTLTGSVLLENSGTMTSLGSQTLDTGSIVFGDTFGRVVLVGNTILTLGPDMVVRGKSGNLNGTGKLINQGLISADVAGGTITINPSQFENTGTLAAIAAGSTVVVRVNPFTNNGMIQELNGGKVLINP